MIATYEQELVIQNLNSELQRAQDPLLCNWAEWHYLVLLSHFLQTGDLGSNPVSAILIRNAAEGDREETAMVLGKEWLDNLSSKYWSGSRNMKLGARTKLIFTGTYKGLVTVPNGQNSLGVGRWLGQGFGSIDTNASSSSLSPSTREYVKTAYDIIQGARQPHESYAALADRGISALAAALERSKT